MVDAIDHECFDAEKQYWGVSCVNTEFRAALQGIELEEFDEQKHSAVVTDDVSKLPSSNKVIVICDIRTQQVVPTSRPHPYEYEKRTPGAINYMLNTVNGVTSASPLVVPDALTPVVPVSTTPTLDEIEAAIVRLPTEPPQCRISKNDWLKRLAETRVSKSNKFSGIVRDAFAYGNTFGANKSAFLAVENMIVAYNAANP